MTTAVRAWRGEDGLIHVHGIQRWLVYTNSNRFTTQDARRLAATMRRDGDSVGASIVEAALSGSP